MTDNQDSVTAGAAQPPTDRPLTAGDVLPMMALAMDKLMRAFPADCMPSASVCVEVANAVNAAKEVINRPATSAASEGAVDRVMAVLNHWFDGRARIDRNSDMVAQLAALASPPVSAEGLEECDTCGRLKVMGCRCDYASPPVSERERELEGALREIEAMCPATCETSLAHDMAQIASEALTALNEQPQ